MTQLTNLCVHGFIDPPINGFCIEESKYSLLVSFKFISINGFHCFAVSSQINIMDFTHFPSMVIAQKSRMGFQIHINGVFQVNFH